LGRPVLTPIGRRRHPRSAADARSASCSFASSLTCTRPDVGPGRGNGASSPAASEIGYHGTGANITLQVEAEARLRDNEARFRQLFEAASDWFWEQHAEGRLTFVSPRQWLFTGDTRSKNIGLRRDEYGDTSIHPERWRAYQNALEERRPFRDFIYRHAQPDANGRIRWTKTSGLPVFARDGTLAAIAARHAT
jgi:PAS domain S-box-containing protein